ncbi:SDR family NAD(P)-dependent oxidoreductase [Lichenifustis flavocetrariae]|uniref:SDR family oxidoreductase n=1 Tax=Lichenifustis flavocetrariae TaxID=2949735 RepID=A0AA42CQ81_9HYPH|nr:SDR family oxidoreductase [Lichenifustis flavocetrariae]MCW6511180.1 SDR family oxidoreductase [Lichenifustis flavocetrariae]
MRKLEGRVAFIAGGSQGIGEQTALLFAREGASVAVLASTDLGKAERVAQAIRDAGGSASAYAADVRKADAVKVAVAAAVAAHGPIDILVNSAGVFPPTPSGSTEPDAFERVMDINVKGTWNTIEAIAPEMRARKTGWIVDISSVLGTMALANYAAYCASKAAVNMLTRSLAIEFGRDGVHVNAIAPGNTATPMNENLRTEEQYRGFLDMMTARTPSGRTYSQPEEIARMALYLACEDSKPVHGAIMVMDEGFSLGV